MNAFTIQCLAFISALVLSLSHTIEGRYFDYGPLEFDVDTEERDALFPITQYAGMGYNLLRGNPEGDFERGGKDPGIYDTRRIFNLTYTLNKEGYYNGKTVAVPDQVEFQPRHSCASRSLTKAYSGQTSYQDELKRNFNLGFSVGVLSLANLGFSLSAGMKEVKKNTEDKRQVIIQETKICNIGTVRYKEELGGANYVLSQGFKNAVKNLPNVYKNQAAKRAYLTFIEKWGTHVIVSAEFGTRWMERQSASYSQVYKYLYNQKNHGGSVKGGIVIKGVSLNAEAGIGLETINDNVDQYTSIGSSNTTLEIGSSDNPAPIRLELKSIAEVVDKTLWGPSWEEDRVTLKQKNLEEALKMYPIQTGASISKDPKLQVHPKLSWLSGPFALPMPKSGCPQGINSGCVKQDTYNLIFSYNTWTHGIENRLKVDVNSNYITTCFCVKDEQDLNNDNITWPQGSYCIAEGGHGPCPRGFHEGFIKWDDKDFRNKNERNGPLPRGKFDTNTEIYFCCRNDAEPTKQIEMPTEVPFALYRYFGKCQAVAGMRVWEGFIKWKDELIWNKDKRSGSYPDDDGDKKEHKLHYCHYSVDN